MIVAQAHAQTPELDLIDGIMVESFVTTLRLRQRTRGMPLDEAALHTLRTRWFCLAPPDAFPERVNWALDFLERDGCLTTERRDGLLWIFPTARLRGEGRPTTVIAWPTDPEEWTEDARRLGGSLLMHEMVWDAERDSLADWEKHWKGEIPRPGQPGARARRRESLAWERSDLLATLRHGCTDPGFISIPEVAALACGRPGWSNGRWTYRCANPHRLGAMLVELAHGGYLSFTGWKTGHRETAVVLHRQRGVA